MVDFWLAELDDELHECHLPRPERARSYACECGCEWQVFRTPQAGVHWVLMRDPDRVRGG
jgi:hypothetical protein